MEYVTQPISPSDIRDFPHFSSSNSHITQHSSSMDEMLDDVLIDDTDDSVFAYRMNICTLGVHGQEAALRKMIKRGNN